MRLSKLDGDVLKQNFSMEIEQNGKDQGVGMRHALGSHRRERPLDIVLQYQKYIKWI
jgi:hypothetical protein